MTREAPSVPWTTPGPTFRPRPPARAKLRCCCSRYSRGPWEPHDLHRVTVQKTSTACAAGGCPITGRGTRKHTSTTELGAPPAAAAATKMPEESKEVDILPRLRGILMSSDFSNQFEEFAEDNIEPFVRVLDDGKSPTSNTWSTTTSSMIFTDYTSKRSRRRSKSTSSRRARRWINS